MKQILKQASILGIALLSQAAVAESVRPDPNIGTTPNPVVTLSDEATEMAIILLNGGVSDCVEKFKQHVTTALTFKKQILSETDARYTIDALILQGGDMIAGNSQIVINKTQMSDLFWPELKVDSYSCTYSENLLF